jgi:hypothetical protein
LMFTNGSGAWTKSAQSRPMRAACPVCGSHRLSASTRCATLGRPSRVMAGVPLLVVARDVGHTDTRMVDRHYGHLARSHVTEAIHAGAPRYDVKTPKRVVPLRCRRRPGDGCSGALLMRRNSEAASRARRFLPTVNASLALLEVHRALARMVLR